MKNSRLKTKAIIKQLVIGTFVIRVFSVKLKQLHFSLFL